MSHRFFPIVLPTKEWERLKRQGGTMVSEKNPVDCREEYFDLLNEQSRKWINHWPDSAEGVREKLEKQKKEGRKQNILLIEAFKKSKKHENRQEAVMRAKQLIFDDSCYGRQLISATIQSRTIEEREVQIAIQKEIKQRERELENNKIYDDSYLNFDNTSDADRKLAALECVKINKEIERLKKETAAKLKAEKNQCESVDEDMVKQIRETNAKKKAEIKRLQKQEVEEYEAIRKEIEKHRKISEDRDNALVESYKKDQDRVKCKVNAVLKKIIEEKRHGERAVTFFKFIDEIQKAEKKKYEDFVEKGIKVLEERNALKEEKAIEKEKKRREESCKISEKNRIAANKHELCQKHTAVIKKTILSKTDRETSKIIEKDDTKKVAEQFNSKDKPSFLKPRTELLQALKKRERDPSGYTGTKAADNYFAAQANDAILGAKHKYFARKVVDEYIKMNCPDPSDLAMPNY